jgi:hypothetical protein
MLFRGAETDCFMVEMLLMVMKDVEGMVAETPCFAPFLQFAYR